MPDDEIIFSAPVKLGQTQNKTQAMFVFADQILEEHHTVIGSTAFNSNTSQVKERRLIASSRREPKTNVRTHDCAPAIFRY